MNSTLELPFLRQIIVLVNQLIVSKTLMFIEMKEMRKLIILKLNHKLLMKNDIFNEYL